MEDLHGPRATAEALFRAVYADTQPDVLRFVTRRVCPSHAEDVVAEVFLVVWRRLAELPTGRSDARAWIFGVARGVLLNTQRGERRQEALEIRLADASTVSPHRGAADPEIAARRADLVAAWPRLAATDQEALSLAYWEGLTSTEAAAVLNISPVAFRLRLTRARRRLRRHLDLIERAASPSLLPQRSSS